jgi:hypothetical protein
MQALHFLWAFIKLCFAAVLCIIFFAIGCVAWVATVAPGCIHYCRDWAPFDSS